MLANLTLDANYPNPRHLLPQPSKSTTLTLWSETNQRVLRESIESFERGEAKRHELIEA